VIADWARAAIERELEERFVTSSGPGGQNVNKVASAVQLRFNIPASAAFTEPQRARLLESLKARLTDAGDLLIIADEHRSQLRNREAARERLFATLGKALEVRRKRIPTRPTLASKRRRLDDKARRSGVKSQRGRIDADE
jgi:ribosome-associated protein